MPPRAKQGNLVTRAKQYVTSERTQATFKKVLLLFALIMSLFFMIEGTQNLRNEMSLQQLREYAAFMKERITGPPQNDKLETTKGKEDPAPKTD